MANGHCDNMLLATYLSATCPVWVAPAMDEDMWYHPSTKRNLDALSSFGNHLIPVRSGELASGLTGPGRMAEPEEILELIIGHFNQTNSMAGKKALVTAGPTYEPIDPVRFIGNHSSGKMGVALAKELAARGAMVQLVAGPGVQAPEDPRIQVHRVTTAEQMYAVCTGHYSSVDLAIMSAAVADYTPESVASEKIKKTEGGMDIRLVKTRDILKELGQLKKANQVLVGFALETNNEKANALQKLESKNADLIVLNSLQDKGAGFGVDTNKITVFDRRGDEINFPVKPKTEVAADIVDLIQNKFYA
jgi:phosphopantothenoylcysteine decarboxylase/phosphopantothenate--cysteine ligase